MSEVRIYFYKMTADNGGAPCVANGLLSLAICKPFVRSTAQKDDWIIGFAANSLWPDNRLIYVAEVTCKLTSASYYKSDQYRDRPDCIYEFRDRLLKERAGAQYHGGAGDLENDCGEYPDYSRANVLLSTRFCYHGASGTDEYKQKYSKIADAIAALGIGHRVNHTEELFEQLKMLANSCVGAGGEPGRPTSEPGRGISQNGESWHSTDKNRCCSH